MKARDILCTASCALIIAATCALPHPGLADVVNSVVAVVGDEVITQRQLDQALRAKGQTSPKAVVDPLTRQKAIDDLIDEKLMDQILAKSKIEVTEDDVARAIAGVIRQNGIGIEQLRNEVSAKGLSWDDYKKQIETQVKRVKFVNQVIGPQVKITDQDLRDFYRQNQERFRGDVRAHIAQIFLPFENFQSQADVEAFKAQAIDISNKARHGADFKELARKYSKGANAENGGDLGTVELKDLPEPVALTVKTLGQGEVSTPVATDNGLFIVKVISLSELSANDFDKLRDDIYSAIYEQRAQETLRSYLQKERSKVYIEIM